TMLVSDWSSDVCSSDVGRGLGHGHTAQSSRGRGLLGGHLLCAGRGVSAFVCSIELARPEYILAAAADSKEFAQLFGAVLRAYHQIGRASCRARASTSVV